MLDLPCDAHIVSTSQGRGFSAVAELVSGAISCSLLQRLGGAPGKFRTCLADVLFASTIIIDAVPPLGTDPCNSRRNALLKALMPRTKRGAQRSASLKRLENSDLDSDEVL